MNEYRSLGGMRIQHLYDHLQKEERRLLLLAPTGALYATWCAIIRTPSCLSVDIPSHYIVSIFSPPQSRLFWMMGDSRQHSMIPENTLESTLEIIQRTCQSEPKSLGGANAINIMVVLRRANRMMDGV